MKARARLTDSRDDERKKIYANSKSALGSFASYGGWSYLDHERYPIPHACENFTDRNPPALKPHVLNAIIFTLKGPLFHHCFALKDKAQINPLLIQKGSARFKKSLYRTLRLRSGAGSTALPFLLHNFPRASAPGPERFHRYCGSSKQTQGPSPLLARSTHCTPKAGANGDPKTRASLTGFGMTNLKKTTVILKLGHAPSPPTGGWIKTTINSCDPLPVKPLPQRPQRNTEEPLNVEGHVLIRY
jgi:hypothetical protein